MPESASNFSVRHDNIAELLGVKARSFEATNPDAMMGIRRELLDYVQRLKDLLAGNTHSRQEKVPLVSVIADEKGWPQLVGFDATAKVAKHELEDVIRGYLNAHYGKPNSQFR